MKISKGALHLLGIPVFHLENKKWNQGKANDFENIKLSVCVKTNKSQI